MTQPPPATGAPARLHERNARRLGAHDIVMATQTGSGATLLGNILLELDIDVLDPFGAVIDEDGSVRANEPVLAKRERISAVASKERSLRNGSATSNPEVRFFKNFLAPEVFSAQTVRGVVLLVRDPRDAVYSKYCFLRDFGELIPAVTISRSRALSVSSSRGRGPGSSRRRLSTGPPSTKAGLRPPTGSSVSSSSVSRT